MKQKGKIKILGIADNEGSCYHRIVLPYTALNGRKIEVDGKEYEIEFTLKNADWGNYVFEEDDFKNNDIVVNTWVPSNFMFIISEWRNKYNTIWINDYDDIIPDDSSHPNYSKEILQFLKTQIIQSLVEADAITTSTDAVSKFLSINSGFVLKVPNYLPFGSGQFPKNLHKDINGKIAIGIIGSLSHLQDYLEIKNIIKKIANDSQIHKNCKFVIAGSSKTKEFKKILNIFNCNKAMEVEVVESLPANSYMSLYSKVDILLAPLKHNKFNLAKSSLKLSEAACYSIPVIGGDLYMMKDLTAYCGCKKPADYYEFIKFFVKNPDKIKELGEQFAEQNIADSHWDKRLELLEELIKTVLFNPEFKEGRNKEYAKIWGIIFDKDQFTEYTPVFNQTKEKAWRFEYAVMLDKLPEIEKSDKHIGIFSWKFAKKTNMYKRLVNELVKENSKIDVISFSPSHNFNDRYLQFSYEQHPKLQEILQKVCNRLNLVLPEEVDKVIYSNFFVAKPEIYTRYIEEVIIPALDYMENEIWDEVNVDAIYKSGLEKEKLKEYTGLDFYNLVTFTLERMLSVWLYNNPNITFLQVG